MKVKDLKQQLENQPDDAEVALFVKGKDYQIEKIGKTAAYHNGKTLYRPNLVLIDGK